MVTIQNIIKTVFTADAKNTNKVFKQMNKNLVRYGENTKKATKGFSNMFKSIRNGLLGTGLSMLFTGMAIKRFADNTIKSVTKAFMDVTDNTNKTHKQITRLQASFEFLKFSILETLGETDLFINVMNFLIKMNRAMGQFVAQHPNLVKIFSVVAILASVFGALMMVVGQTGLGFLGIVSAVEQLLPLLVSIGAVNLGAMTGAVLVAAGAFATIALYLAEYPEAIKVISDSFKIVETEGKRITELFLKLADIIGIDLVDVGRFFFAMFATGIRLMAEQLSSVLGMVADTIEAIAALSRGDYKEAGALAKSAAGNVGDILGSFFAPTAFIETFREVMGELKAIELKSDIPEDQRQSIARPEEIAMGRAGAQQPITINTTVSLDGAILATDESQMEGVLGGMIKKNMEEIERATGIPISG